LSVGNIPDIETYIASLSAHINDVTDQIPALSDKIASVSANMDIFNQNVANSINIVGTTSAALNSLNNVVTLQSTKISDLQSDLLSLQSDYFAMKNPLLDDVADLKSQAATMSGVLATIYDVQTQVATVNGTLRSQTDILASHSAELSDLTTRLNNIESLIMASGSGILGPNLSTQSASLNIDQDAVFYGNVNVLGKAVLSDLGVTGKFTAGILSIDGLDTSVGTESAATINTLGGMLKIQADALNSIQFEGGKIDFDTLGNITTTGQITATKFNINNTATESASLGQAVLGIGTTNTIIKTAAVTGNSEIFVTPKKKVPFPLAVTEKVASDSFKVEIPATAEADIDFSWLIIN
jgi:uncharacterized coiled-coil protein SlyX